MWIDDFLIQLVKYWGKSVHCKFNLLNPNDYFTLQFVSLEKLSTPEINPRIEGLSKIDIVGSNVVQPDFNTTGGMLIGFFLVLIGTLSQKAGRPRLFRAGMEAVNFPY